MFSGAESRLPDVDMAKKPPKLQLMEFLKRTLNQTRSQLITKPPWDITRSISPALISGRGLDASQ